MASVQDIKRRVRSVQNTRKITRAMELVAAAKLRRAQSRIEAMRPYAERMQELMIGVARASTSLQGLPLLQRRDVRTTAILPLTGDRGLAGAFNAQILREAFSIEGRLRGENVEPYWLVAGKKGASTLRFRRYEVGQAWTGFSDSPRYADAQALRRDLELVLAHVHSRHVARGSIRKLLWQVDVFGFHLAGIDIRQGAGVVREATGALLPGFAEADEERRMELLTEALTNGRRGIQHDPGGVAGE